MLFFIDAPTLTALDLMPLLAPPLFWNFGSPPPVSAGSFSVYTLNKWDGRAYWSLLDDFRARNVLLECIADF